MLSLLRRPPPSSAASLSVTRCYRGFSYSSVSSTDMSRITISGKLVRTPELSTTSSGRQCVRYTIRSWQGKERTNFFSFLCITENARCIEYLTNIPRGSRVVAEGQFSPYQLANEDGSKVQKYSIFSNALHVIERAESGAAAGEATQAQEAPEPTEAAQAQEAPEPTEAAQAQEAPEPTEAAQAQEEPEPTDATQVQEASAPTEAAQAQEEPAPTEAAQAQEAPELTEAAQAQEASAPTEGGEAPDVKPH